MERIDKILSNSGFGTRKEVKKLIKYGVVKVDNVTVTSSDTKVDPEKSVITVNDNELVYKEFVYLMLNKPDGYVSATEDNVYPTVTELVPEEFELLELLPLLLLLLLLFELSELLLFFFFLVSNGMALFKS